MRFFLFFCLSLACFSSYFGQPLLRGNSDAVYVIITVMTVFAGFLVAIITIIGDPALIPDGSWRIAELRRESVQSRLAKFTWLFVLYLVAIGFLFVGVLLDNAPDKTAHLLIKVWIERLYLFFGVFSFALTFSLPAALWRLQMARIDAEIRRRRREAGIID